MTEPRENLATPRAIIYQAKTPAKVGVAFLSGAAIGSLVSYLLDPHQGARRRGELRDRAVSASRNSGRRALKLSRHLRNQIEGVVSYAADLIRPEGLASDRKLADRIRSSLGHSCSHLSAVELHVKKGDVIVGGHAPESEIPSLLNAISKVRGVRSVTDQVERGSGPASQPIQ